MSNWHCNDIDTIIKWTLRNFSKNPYQKMYQMNPSVKLFKKKNLPKRILRLENFLNKIPIKLLKWILIVYYIINNIIQKLENCYN